ncbi:poxB regulator PoxA [Gammaproteobacteria bacterium SCGC AG-212-F23]|nr:poxB regulator PoxA [Gammaproteobacteria bacterium SCGC AG-212-F23]
MSWKPTASFKTLHTRAKILAQVRDFFSKRNVLEVQTPLLSSTSVTDPYIQSIPAIFQKTGSQIQETLYLQTSPEYAMKRLLAAGSGPIFQICKAFRQGEVGTFHQPEFTMLEWYRPDFNHHDLMNEMDDLLQLVLNKGKAERLSYAAAFVNTVGINPHFASLEELSFCAKKNGILVNSTITDRDAWLDLILTHCIEPHFANNHPVFLYDFPISQAALAKIRNEDPPVASRFEVYYKGIELANGFHELQDSDEQRRRFENNLHQRNKLDLSPIPIDEHFLAALSHGLPDCSGVALGLDRLLMLILSAENIREVVSFGF